MGSKIPLIFFCRLFVTSISAWMPLDPAVCLLTYYCVLCVVCEKACVEMRLASGLSHLLLLQTSCLIQSGAFWLVDWLASKLSGPFCLHISPHPRTEVTGACYCAWGFFFLIVSSGEFKLKYLMPTQQSVYPLSHLSSQGLLLFKWH